MGIRWLKQSRKLKSLFEIVVYQPRKPGFLLPGTTACLRGEAEVERLACEVVCVVEIIV
jgi:hypothetical protein